MSLRFFWLLLLVVAVASAGTSEDQARAVLDQWSAALKAKDFDAASRLLSKDCVIIMTEPMAGAKRARFFTHDSYLAQLKERFSKTTATTSKETIHAVSASDTGDVFVMMESEERASVDQRSEWFRYHLYLVLRPVEGKMLIRLVVSQLAFYVPDVPPAPEQRTKK